MTNTKILKCISPIDGSLYAERETFTSTEAHEAASRAKVAQVEWAKKSIKERSELVNLGVLKLGEIQEETTIELAHQMGRPIRYGGEYSGFQFRADTMAGLAEKALAPIIVEDSDAFVRRIDRIPLGVVLVIAPWNYPYMSAVNTVVPALIAGNSVLLKHSEQTLLVGERIEKAFHEAGIPKDVFQNVLLSHETTGELISSSAFDFVNFTGSVGGGKAMEIAAAGTFTGVGTELGGKDPGYVREDADLDAAVDTLIDGAMYNAGQCCCGIERIYVHESLFDAFIEKATAIVKGYKLGNPLDPETTIGPMATVRFANEVRAQIDEAIEQGARRCVDVFAEDDGGAYLSPTILINVNHDMRVMREESFGPVVGIMSVKDDAEAIALMNDSEFGLTASIWTKDADKAYEIGSQIETGTVYMNRCDFVDPELCWTGCKDTGRGGGLSVIGYHNLTRPKSFHLKKQ
ncbi:aldehyde dehydrogenase family protein [Cocleimonas sp. KMM 6892]|uniref:aldehyde dehydrogenase family protein n=1 Tax=unclassified Cocleimonas TaxID=2639732 RepID=UPI002DBD4EE0|nr:MULTISPECIES: aldehyde dehydrogenase family protein [unclassified Cocleimonas]MEB8432666.1 aldehyde dehydrogenase family protein [Cocleimonas sp. KMM 6892]MEC4715525.1 aldehyde dehydrogenase family protein [Cocleimonas sp. KMM 6895]MEC4744857.1 aldehyde dehydrogenase family protein [Cocleimonas sp. KMM 6896]